MPALADILILFRFDLKSAPDFSLVRKIELKPAVESSLMFKTTKISTRLQSGG
jgi:hypothetical protein